MGLWKNDNMNVNVNVNVNVGVNVRKSERVAMLAMPWSSEEEGRRGRRREGRMEV